MLSQEQLEQRSRGVGASEIGAIVGVNKHRTASDVWLTKRRGRDLELAPIVQPQDDAPGVVGPRVVGQIAEAAIVELYRRARGVDVVLVEVGTLVHADHPWAMATPDRVELATVGEPQDRSLWRAGLEAKMVGYSMRHDWDDGLPPYVMCQVQWCMHVSGLARWNVAALRATEYRQLVVDRDDEMIGIIHEAVASFWRDHVLADVPPDAGTSAAAMRLVEARFPGATDEVVDVGDPPEVLDVVREYLSAHADKADAEEREQRAKAKLCELVGERKGIRGPWGSFQWPIKRGAPKWREVAERLAGGPVPEHIIDELRGANYRAATMYPKKSRAA